MTSQPDDSEIWDREFDSLQVIPSSLRTAPSKALLLFAELIDFRLHNKVLDAGSGNGRNTVYLAQRGCEVHAIDSATIAIQRTKDLVDKAGVAERVSIYPASLQPHFPFGDRAFDLVLDSYVFCHVTDQEEKDQYKTELHRVTRPNGLVYSSAFSVDDEYYRTVGQFPAAESRIVTDPNNGITKNLYLPKEFNDYFADRFEIVYFVNFQFGDSVLGKNYRRSILASVMKPRG